jgi:hypothetical protein
VELTRSPCVYYVDGPRNNMDILQVQSRVVLVFIKNEHFNNYNPFCPSCPCCLADRPRIHYNTSSAVRCLFVRLAGAVGRQSALHKENSGFAAPTAEEVL